MVVIERHTRVAPEDAIIAFLYLSHSRNGVSLQSILDQRQSSPALKHYSTDELTDAYHELRREGRLRDVSEQYELCQGRLTARLIGEIQEGLNHERAK